MVVWVVAIVGIADSVMEGIGEGSTERMILKRGYGYGSGCGVKSESPYWAEVAADGMLVTKTAK
jgi:hypothetical protein